MKPRTIAIAVMLITSIAAVAVEGDQVEYYGGTLSSVKAGQVGQLVTSSNVELTFSYPGGSFAIPYLAMKSYEYSQEVAHHLGVAPAIAVGLVKKRQRRHYIRITYADAAGAMQVAVFEVPKEMPRTLIAILQSRAPQGCKPLGTCSFRSH